MNNSSTSVGDPYGLGNWRYWTQPTPQNYGWICPRCGKGVAPWATNCLCGGHYYIQITDNTAPPPDPNESNPENEE